LCGESVEDGDVDRDLVEEDAEASADGGSAVAGGREDEADARGDVDGLGREAVVVETKAEVEREAGIDLPAVLKEEGKLVFGRL